MVGGTNRFGYAGANPTNFVDPFGLETNASRFFSEYVKCLESGNIICDRALNRGVGEAIVRDYGDAGKYAGAKGVEFGEICTYCILLKTTGIDARAVVQGDYRSSTFGAARVVGEGALIYGAAAAADGVGTMAAQAGVAIFDATAAQRIGPIKFMTKIFSPVSKAHVAYEVLACVADER